MVKSKPTAESKKPLQVNESLDLLETVVEKLTEYIDDLQNRLIPVCVMPPEEVKNDEALDLSEFVPLASRILVVNDHINKLICKVDNILNNIQI